MRKQKWISRYWPIDGFNYKQNLLDLPGGPNILVVVWKILWGSFCPCENEVLMPCVSKWDHAFIEKTWMIYRDY